MVRFLTSATFCAALIRGRSLLEGDAYSELSVGSAALNRGQRLFEARRLLEEIRYLKTVPLYLCLVKKFLFKYTFFLK